MYTSDEIPQLLTVSSWKKKYIVYGIIFLLVFLPIIFFNSSTSKMYSPQITITKSIIKSTRKIIRRISTIASTTRTSTTIRSTSTTILSRTTTSTSISIQNTTNITLSTSTTTTTTTNMGDLCDSLTDSNNLSVSRNPCEQIRCAVLLRQSGGRLGNRMFIFASAYGLARVQDCRLYVDSSIRRELSDSFRMELIDERMWLSNEQYAKLSDVKIWDTVCTFMYQLIRPNAFKNIELIGYWQSYLYFDAYREEIREIFSGRNDTLILIAQYFTDITKDICPLCQPLPNTTQKELRQAFRTRYNITWIGIHIRRVDFRGIGYSSDEDYIRRAIIYFQRRYYYRRVRFLVASDDKSYCDELFVRLKRSKKAFILPHHFSAADDMIALTLCHHSIVTGGTYSFWTAYLAGGEVIHDVKYQAVCSRADYYPPWFVLVGPTIEKRP